MVFMDRCLLCLTELVLGIFYLLFLILQDFSQRLHMFLKLLPRILRRSKFFLHANLPGLKTVQLILHLVSPRPNTVQLHLMVQTPTHQPFHHHQRLKTKIISDKGKWTGKMESGRHNWPEQYKKALTPPWPPWHGCLTPHGRLTI